jgi:hypothetical protein
MTPRTCQTPGGDHEGPARLYPGGWLCSRHTPAKQAGRDEPPTTQQEK